MFSKEKTLKLANFRISFYSALFLIVGIFCAYAFHKNLLLGVFFIFAIAVIVLNCLYKNLTKISILFFASVVIGAFLCNSWLANAPIYHAQWQKGVTVNGRVVQAPYQTEDKMLVVLGDVHVLSENTDIKLNKKIVLHVRGTGSVQYGDLIEANTKLYVNSMPDNPLEPNYYLSSLAAGAGYYCYIDAENIIVKENKADIYGLFVRIREQILMNINMAVKGNDAKLLEALTVGETGGLDGQIKEDFSDTGLSHILAVSGLHIAFLVLILRKLLQLLKVKRQYLFGLLFAFILSYCAITAFAVSVIRAAVMLTVILFTEAIGKRYDALNSLGMAAFILLILNPIQLFTISFQLSFCACLGIAIFQNIFTAKNKYVNKALALINVTLGASLATLPFIIYYFNKVSLISLITNFLMVPVSSVIIAFSFIASILCMVVQPAGLFLLVLAGKVTQIFYAFVNWSADLPFSRIFIATPPVWTVFVFMAVLFLNSRFLLLRRKWKAIISLLTACIYIFILMIPSIVHEKRLTVTILSVGNALCVHIKTTDNRNYLVDTADSLAYKGGTQGSAEYDVLPYLQRMGISRLDGVLISHEDADHSGGLYVMQGDIKIDHLYYPSVMSYSDSFKSVLNAYQSEHTELAALQMGTTVQMGELSLFILNPPLSSGDASRNENSLAFLMQYGNTSILFAGDIPAKTEKSIIDQYQVKCDILIAGHHGSNSSTSSEWLEELTPTAAVLSEGGLYSDNVSKTIQRLQEHHVNIFDTHDSGAIIINIDPDKNYTINTMR